MTNSVARARLIGLVVLISLWTPLVRTQQKPVDEPEVLRITTDLVQTGVTVFDKQGKFVDGLTPEQFEVKVDGNPVKLSFFDRVTAGSAAEAKQIAAASSGAAPTPAATVPSGLQYRGRTIVF